MKASRPLVALAVLAVSWPAMALGQAQRAGVVTTLEGNVTAARVALPQPLPLKFRDEVFLRDRIVTGDRSLARLLLGDKAIVTVRERSSLTITEVPGRSTVELESGKLGLAVARARMRPGEVIDIRTPNAIVAVRGTVAVVEVTRATAQAGGPPPPVTSSIYLLRGTAEATRLNPATGAPIGTPFALNVLTAFRVTGVGAPVIGPIPPGQLAQIVAGLRASRPQHRDAANKEQVKGQVLDATTTMLNALTGDVVVPEPILITRTTDYPVAPITPVDQGTASGLTGLLLDVPVFSITGSLFLDPGLTLKTFAGATSETRTFIKIGEAPLPLALADLELVLDTVSTQDLLALAAAGATIVAQFGTDNLLEVAPGATVNLVRRLLTTRDATVIAGGNVLRVDGALTVSGLSGLMFFDPSGILAGSDFLFVSPTGTLKVAGPAIAAEESLLVAGGHLVNVAGGRIDSTAAQLLKFHMASAIQADGYIARLGKGGIASLAGPLVLSESSDLFAGGGLISVEPGGQLAVNGIGDAVATIIGGAHSLGAVGGGAALAFQGLGAQTIVADGNTLTVGTGQPIQTARTLLDVVGATVVTDTVARLDTMLFNATAPIFTGRAGASVTAATNGIELAGGVQMVTSAPVVALHDFSSFTVRAGNVLVVNNSVLKVNGDLFSFANGSTLTAGSTAPGQVFQGAMVRVMGSGVLNVSGALASFSGPAISTVNLTNGFCPGGDCTDFNGIRVHCTGSSVGCGSNIQIGGTPIKNAALGQFNMPNDVHIITDPTSKVIIGGN
jgi:FecR protein